MRLRSSLYNGPHTPAGHAHPAVTILERAAGADIVLVGEEALPIDEAKVAANAAMIHMRECLFALGFKRSPEDAAEES